MATAVLRPNGVLGTDDAVVTPSGTSYDATNDTPDDDTSYYTKTAGGGWTWLHFTSTSLPADSVVKTVTPRIRARGSGAIAYGEAFLAVNTTGLSKPPLVFDTTFATYTAPSYVNPTLTQSQIDSLTLAVRATSGTIDVSELFIDVVAAEVPTTTAIEPSGTVTTSTPTISWQHTPGTDGGPQTQWHLKIFSNAQYTAPGFDPLTSAATQTYLVTGAAGSFIPAPLAHDTTYRAYIRTAQSVGGIYQYADWDFTTFTVDIVAPEVDTITMTVDSGFARIVADITRDTGGDTWDHVELQRMAELDLLGDAQALNLDADSNGRADGWDSDTDGTVSVTYSQNSGYQRFAVTGIDNTDKAELQVGELFAISGGSDYSFGVTAKAPTLGANTALTLGVRFFDALGNVLLSSQTILTSTYVSSTERPFVHVGTAPDNAAYAAPTISVLGLTGATSASTTADFRDAWFSAGGDEIWEDVAGAEDITPNTNDVTIIDIGPPGDTPIRYRTRAVDVNDNVGNWVYAADSYEWDQEDSWIKCPTRPGFSTTFCLAVRPEFTWPRRVGVHQIIDSESPRTVSGPRQLRTGTIEIETETQAEYRAVMEALKEPVALFQFLPDYSIDQMWAAIGEITESYFEDRNLSLTWRTLKVAVTEVSGP